MILFDISGNQPSSWAVFIQFVNLIKKINERVNI